MEQTATPPSDDDLRALVARHWQTSDRPGAGALYDDDSVLEFPQSGERFRGRVNIQGFRAAYPTDVALETVRIVGGGAHWMGEHRVTYANGETWHGVAVLELRGTTVVHERIYFGEAFDPPGWRAHWREGG